MTKIHRHPRSSVAMDIVVVGSELACWAKSCTIAYGEVVPWKVGRFTFVIFSALFGPLMLAGLDNHSKAWARHQRRRYSVVWSSFPRAC